MFVVVVVVIVMDQEARIRNRAVLITGLQSNTHTCVSKSAYVVGECPRLFGRL